jgi:hypothetical protein
MKPVVASFLKNLFGHRDDYVPIASALVHTLSVASAVGQGFMNVVNANDSLRLPPELQCTARSYHFGNGF